MFIKRVILNNIRSYINQEIIFHQGSTLLSGDIGSGKTTILLAIEFCLFGMRRDLSGSALLRNGENEGFVELEFSIDGRSVIIKRTLKRYKDGVKQTSGYIITNNTRSDLTAQEIKAKVLALLGYPISLLTKSKNIMYRYTVYTQQEDMKQILMDDKDNRVDTLRKIFGIDKYKNIRQNTLIYIKHMKNIRNRLKGRIDDLDQKTISLDNKNQILEKLNKSLEQVDKDIQELDFDNKKQKFLEIEQKLNKFNSLKNQLDIFNTKKQEKEINKNKLDNDLSNINKEINEFKQKIADFQLEKPTDKTIEQLNTIISETQELFHQTTKQKNILEEKLSHVKTRIIDLRNELETKTDKIKDLKFKKQSLASLEQDLEEKQKIEQEIDQLNEKLHNINLRLNELKVNMTNSEKLKKHIAELDKCPACLQTVSIDHKFTINQKEAAKLSKLNILMQRYNTEKQARVKELQGLNKRFEELKNKEKVSSQIMIEVKNLEEVSQEIDKKKKILENFNKELTKINLELEKTNEINLDDMQKQINDNKQLLEKLNEYNSKLKEQNYLKEQLKDKNNQHTDLNEREKRFTQELLDIVAQINDSNENLKSFENIQEIFVKEKKTYNEIVDKQNDLFTRKASIEKEHEMVSMNIDELRKEIQEKEQDKKKIQYYNQLQNWLEEYFIKLTSVIEKNVMFSIYQQFNDLFKDWFDLLMEDEAISVRLDEEFTPIIEQNGYDIDYGNLSGGERTSVALSYRLALNKVVNEVQSQVKTKDLLILDEPTDGFSTEQLDKVRTVLDELDLAQVIIVSHESKIESFVEDVVRVEKNEHVSSVI